MDNGWGSIVALSNKNKAAKGSTGEVNTESGRRKAKTKTLREQAIERKRAANKDRRKARKASKNTQTGHSDKPMYWPSKHKNTAKILGNGLAASVAKDS